MNLSFSTHGWSGYSWENLVDATIECGLNGIEIANDQCKEFAMPSGPLHKFNTASTVRYLREKNIKITCFNAGTSFADPATADVAYEEIMNRMEMAKNFGVKYVIIYAAKGGNVETAKEVLNKVLPVAEKEDIVILIKTSGMFANTSELKSLLDDFACDYLAASWNMYAPYR